MKSEDTYKKILSILFFHFIYFLIIIPLHAHANNYTLPISLNVASTTAFFDHDDSNNEKYYDGDEGILHSYDNHHGVDFGTFNDEEKEVHAAADGVVKADGWQNPSNHNEGYGYRIYLYHEDYDQRTVYAHATTTADYVDVDDVVARGDVIILSGDTGISSAPHLHFGVYDGDNSDPANQMDPYGWWVEGETDPWTVNQGYLWTTDTPSFDIYNTISSNITSDTTWRGNKLVSGSRTVNSGAKLNLEKGTVVKFFSTSSRLGVSGELDAKGTSAHPIYLTSYKDDSIGGDWDATSTIPTSGDWREVEISSNASSTLSHVIARYGGASVCCLQSRANIYNNGGLLTIKNSESSHANLYGFYNSSGTTTITSSKIHNNYNGVLPGGIVAIYDSEIYNNSNYGFYTANSASVLTIENTTFSNNTNGSGYLNASATFSHSGNSATGTGKKGFELESSVSKDTIWQADSIPYMLSGYIPVSSGAKLTIEPNTVIKFYDTSSYIQVQGTLEALGTSTAKIYFTSLNDDSISGDTNDNATSTTPEAGDWRGIDLASNASTTLSNVIFRYGGSSACCSPHRANIFNNGGVLDIRDSEISYGSIYGVRNDTGTTTISNTEVHNNGYGFIYVGGILNTFSNNSMHDNSTYGFKNNTTSTIGAENNYWGASDGPSGSGSGSGDAVSDHVDYDPWLSSWP